MLHVHWSHFLVRIKNIWISFSANICKNKTNIFPHKVLTFRYLLISLIIKFEMLISRVRPNALVSENDILGKGN